MHPHQRSSQAPVIKVWDPLVRVFHWSLVASFAVAYVSSEGWDWLHSNAGYLVAILVGVRVLWGFVGTRHARFADFVRRPSVVRAYLSDLLRLRQHHYLGHNPAGGMMIVALLVMLALTTLSGMTLYGLDSGSGPFAGLAGLGSGLWIEILEGLHELCANATVILVVVHVSGVILESLLSGENLVRAMWDGYKLGPDDAQIRPGAQ
jgi:cytochrome b